MHSELIEFLWNANTVICLSMCFMCRRHVIMCSSFAFISRHSPFMCGLYTNILPANFVICTLLPIISCAFFDIYGASVSMCSQNFVICGAFSCYLTFNAVLITDRKIMSCGCSLWSRRHVIICSSFAFISRHSPFMCGVYTNILRANFVIRTLLPIISCVFFDIYTVQVSVCAVKTSLYALYFPLYPVLSLIYTVQVSVCAVKTLLYGVCSLCSKLYDDITTMRRENRRTQASSLRVAILILCSREEARFPPWPVLCHPC